MNSDRSIPAADDCEMTLYRNPHDVAEIERLREALRTIATAGERVPDWRAMVDVARDALGLDEKEASDG